MAGLSAPPQKRRPLHFRALQERTPSRPLPALAEPLFNAAHENREGRRRGRVPKVKGERSPIGRRSWRRPNLMVPVEGTDDDARVHTSKDTQSFPPPFERPHPNAETTERERKRDGAVTSTTAERARPPRASEAPGLSEIERLRVDRRCRRRRHRTRRAARRRPRRRDDA